MESICYLNEIGRADTATVGAKAAALGELLHAGFNVPEGFVLTTAAYTRLVQTVQSRIETRLTPEVINDPGEIEAAAADVRAWIEGEPWPAALGTALETAIARFTVPSLPSSFAARTSIPSEELATAFGAGVQRAALGLVGPRNVECGAARCWGALWTSRSIYYRHRKGIPHTHVALAVLVQPMVRATAAGVMFTQSPLPGNAGQVQIDAVWGLGAPLMQARVRPDRFLVRTTGEIEDRQIAEKNVYLTIDDRGELEQVAVARERTLAPSVGEEQIAKLSRLGKEIERLFGEPQDIEWALEEDRIFILQSRPIALRHS